MIIDRPGLKKIALWAGLFLVALLGSCYIFGGGQPQESSNKAKPVIARQSQSSKAAPSSFCARYRMEREKIRSQEVSLLNQVVDKGGSQSEARSKALQRLVQISSDIDREMKMENLVRCHGVRDCVVMIEPNITTVILASSPMSEEKTTEIKSGLSQVSGDEKSKISLIFQDY